MRRGVVVIGHRGILGSAIAAHFKERGADVLGVDRANYESLRSTAVDLVVNANGSSDRRLAARDPAASAEMNVQATVASTQDFPHERYVHISSTSVYSDQLQPANNHESAPIDPAALSSYGFLKFLGEMVVRRFARNWVVLRVGPVVGPGLRKNAIFDLLERRTLFSSPESSQQYVSTEFVAQCAWALSDRAGETFNVCGAGNVRLGDVAQCLGVDLSPSLYGLPRDDQSIDIRKLSRECEVPSSLSTILSFAARWRGDR